MTSPNANAYIVQGISSYTEGSGYRWAFAHPVVRFLVPKMQHPRFVMDFALPQQTFQSTGPVTITFSLNGRFLDRSTWTSPGQLNYQHEVPPGLIRWDAVNVVAIDPDKVWTSREDGAKLAFVVARLGFVE
jgi:hypothetical protein